MKTNNLHKIPDQANLLDLIPIGAVGHRISESGKVDLLIPKFKNEKFARWFIPKWKSLHVTMHLDEQGSKVFLAMNGEKNIQQISEELEKEIGDDTFIRIGKFVSHLYRNGCITFKQLNEL